MDCWCGNSVDTCNLHSTKPCHYTFLGVKSNPSGIWIADVVIPLILVTYKAQNHVTIHSYHNWLPLQTMEPVSFLKTNTNSGRSSILPLGFIKFEFDARFRFVEGDDPTKWWIWSYVGSPMDDIDLLTPSLAYLSWRPKREPTNWFLGFLLQTIQDKCLKLKRATSLLNSSKKMEPWSIICNEPITF